MQAMPRSVKNGIQLVPSFSIASHSYPPPGHITTALPVALPLSGRHTRMFAFPSGEMFLLNCLYAEECVCSEHSRAMRMSDKFFVIMFVVLICISVSRCMAAGKNGFVLPYYLPAHIMFAMLEIIETKVDKYNRKIC